MLFWRILAKLEFSGQIFEKISDIKCQENPSSGNRVVTCGQTDVRRTNATKLLAAFRNLASAPNSNFYCVTRLQMPSSVTQEMLFRLYQNVKLLHGTRVHVGTISFPPIIKLLFSVWWYSRTLQTLNSAVSRSRVHNFMEIWPTVFFADSKPNAGKQTEGRTDGRMDGRTDMVSSESIVFAS